MITVVARFFSSSQKGSACRCFLLFLLYEVISAFIVAIYGRVVFKAFTDAGTSLTTRLLLRSEVHSTVAVLATSFCGWFHHQLVEELGIEPHRATVVYTGYSAFFPLAGRRMQSSADSVLQAVAFEILTDRLQVHHGGNEEGVLGEHVAAGGGVGLGVEGVEHVGDEGANVAGVIIEAPAIPPIPVLLVVKVAAAILANESYQAAS